MSNIGVIITLAIGLIFWAFFIWVTNEPKWSHWMPVMVNDNPGFSHTKYEDGFSDDMMRDNPIIKIEVNQFIPLTEFIGKGFKPVTLAEWQKLYANSKPYRWHVTADQLYWWQRKQAKKLLSQCT